MSNDAPVTCLIGAGSSGIAAAKTLHERGLPFDCFELGDRVGGNWVFRNNNGVSSSYRSLHINTSRERMEFSDFPMPKSYPDFPRHDHIAKYFDDYVDHFGFRDRIRFGVGVEHVERRPDGRFEVRTSDGETSTYDAVIVANGHHWDARWPEPPFPGSEDFAGEQMHSHYYEEEAQVTGKDVVVLGMGNSAMDIAVDASYHAKNTYLAARRGAYVVPKYIFGKPVDQIGGAEWIPSWIRFPIMSLLLKVTSARWRTTACRSRITSSPTPIRRSAGGSSTGSPTARSRRSPTSPRSRRHGPVHRRQRGPRRPRRLLHRLPDHLPVLRRGLRRGQGQRAAALPVHVPPRIRQPLLPRADPAARGDHADRRAPVGPGQRGGLLDRYTLPSRAVMDADIWPTSAGG